MKQKLLPRLPESGGFELVGADTREGVNGLRVGTDGFVTAQVKASRNTKMFKRNGIRMPMGDTRPDFQARVQILVMEMDGVRCYVHSDKGVTNIVMSREDLYP
jgi:hypothetical protein